MAKNYSSPHGLFFTAEKPFLYRLVGRGLMPRSPAAVSRKQRVSPNLLRDACNLVPSFAAARP
ncbi:MAG: hypothetical protein R2788_26360 [Saprospiraceae bacterium]